MNKRRLKTLVRALSPLFAIYALLDMVVRADGALTLLEELAKRVLSFAEANEPRADLVASLALVLVAVPLLKALGPKLPDELRGLAYTALLIAGVLVFYPIAVHPSSDGARRSSGGHSTATGGRPTARSRHARGTSHVRASQTQSHSTRRVEASSSSSGQSERRPEASYGTATASTGSSTTSTRASADPSNPAPQQTDARQPVRQTEAPIRHTTSPSVEIKDSRTPSVAPSAKTSPAVEVQSDQAHGSGIEVANN